jgi:hypothetical protein
VLTGIDPKYWYETAKPSTSVLRQDGSDANVIFHPCISDSQVALVIPIDNNKHIDITNMAEILIRITSHFHFEENNV